MKYNMEVCKTNFMTYLTEKGAYSFFNPFDDDVIKKIEPTMVSDVTNNSLQKQKQAYSTPCTELVKTPKGYSVFATKDFRIGDIVEIAPALIQGQDAYNLKSIQDVLFEIDKESGIYALVLGNGSLYASSNDPNVEYAWSKNNQNMYFVARRDIKRGEELTIDYGDEYWKERIPQELNKVELDDENGIGSIISKIFFNKNIK